ncbi:MAG TPA: branched-chain amino acid ABC transporter permease [Smithella sp.]|nr:branched-chain amino acid ABC transporter permease [Smithella sp.]MDM7986759.1 branched-chain amino acid ABC transporter permease [Smithella sp.]HNY50884.1 branched-chain amino acid ABC transporter permease [Smithella sp.]HOG90866.1 branched-chain amino acid ABC transporter permease [Smithella sp.]HOU50294.1 branched-chain amino acid ABC transporter permease [Smithella sp.]
MFEMLLIEGIAIGACYGLFGVAVAIIYKTSDVINFAQGEMGMVATFVAYHILTVYNVPFWIALPATLIFAVLLGMAIEFCFLRPAKDPTVLGLLIITLGAEMLLMGFAGWKWGAEQKDFPFLLSVTKTHEVAPGLMINEWTIGVFTLTLIIMVFLFLFFRYSKLGIAMRATQQNVNAAKIMGIKVERVFSITWAMSSLIGAIAAMFFAARSVLDPNFMMEPFMRAFAAAVLGGLTSIPGVVIGGLIMGIIENFFGYAWPEWKPIVAFIVIILIITVRPSGLFSKHYVKKV